MKARRRVLAGGAAVAAVAVGGALAVNGGQEPVKAAEPTVARCDRDRRAPGPRGP